MARQKRDIYKGRTDEGFNIDRDVDLVHLRAIMGTEDPSNDDLNHYGLYCKNIIVSDAMNVLRRELSDLP